MGRCMGPGNRRCRSMRVIAGRYRRRPLRSSRGMDIRPTSDRLRETLFDVLTAGNPAALAGTVWLDIFAGTGAVGIEAMSRGAKQVYFVESSPPAAQLIRSNLASLGVTAGYKIVQESWTRACWRIEREHAAADIVFLDPPYRMKDAYGETLRALEDSSLIWAMSVVIAEHEKRFDPGEEFGTLRRFRKLVQGDAALSFYRIASWAPATR
ncbi:MAG TPA: 16S rRNA (guanine(966)-N(2))-methyltransferase RsmD [Candidatus Sulfotelmatobacter sp.]